MFKKSPDELLGSIYKKFEKKVYNNVTQQNSESTRGQNRPNPVPASTFPT